MENMPTQVRSYSKINLGLAIGPPRPDGFHSLVTLYQTIALHDLVTVTARLADRTRIQLTSNDPRVPRDARNTAWKMVTRVLDQLQLNATVNIRIQKNLPIQGGMGAGSANAAAALIGLQHELNLVFNRNERLNLAASVGSDVPLFLVGGSVLGSDRGQLVQPMPDITLGGETEIPCVIALPSTGVSTPQAFRDWDALLAAESTAVEATPNLQNPVKCDTLRKLSRTYASVFPPEAIDRWSGASGILPEPSPASHPGSPENLQRHSREQLHTPEQGKSGFEIDLPGNSLLALVRAGIQNDFEIVVFPQNPLLRDIKQLLMGPSGSGNSAIYAALSGSGSALFGLFRSVTDAEAAQQTLQQHRVEAIVTSTMPRTRYCNNMFAE